MIPGIFRDTDDAHFYAIKGLTIESHSMVRETSTLLLQQFSHTYPDLDIPAECLPPEDLLKNA